MKSKLSKTWLTGASIAAGIMLITPSSLLALGEEGGYVYNRGEDRFVGLKLCPIKIIQLAIVRS